MSLSLRTVFVSGLLSACAYSANAQFSIVVAPALLSGEQQNGVGYETTMRIFNAGRSYGMWEIANEGQVRDLYFSFGYLIPFAYTIRVINESTGKTDAAYWVNSSLYRVDPSDNSNLFPSNATLTFSLSMLGRTQMFGCQPVQLLCTGYPGTEQRYRLVFSVYDTVCGSYVSWDLIHPSCLVAETSTPASTVAWSEFEPAVRLATVPLNNAGVWPLTLYSSPLPSGSPAPGVSSNCTNGRTAQRVRSLVYTITQTPVPDGPFCSQ